MFESLRAKLALKAIAAQLQHQSRKRKVHHLSTARTIALLFDASQEKNKKEVLDWAKSLEKGGKKIYLLGFLGLKKMPEPVPDFPCFTKKELKFNLEPQGEKVTAFLSENIDLLLCFNPDEQLCIEWLAIKSKAAMKIGNATKHPNDFDLQIDIPVEKGVPFFAKQLAEYLNNISL